MKVWIYSERKYGQLGAISFEVTTWTVKPGALGKEEIDPDIDIEEHAWRYDTHDKATAKADKLLARKDLAYGSIRIQEQTLDWFVKEDNVADWEDIGEEEEVTA